MIDVSLLPPYQEFVSFPNNYLRWEWLQIPGQRAWGKSAGEAKASKGTGTSVFFVRCECAIAFAWPCAMPRDLVHQLVHRSASCTWMHGPGEHQQQKKVMLRRRNVVPVVLVVLGLDPTLVQVRSSCHFMSFCLPVSPKNLESIICIAISTGLSSDNFSSNTSHLSTAVFQRCEQRKGWSQSARTTCSSSWRGSWHLFRQSPRTNIELANHLKHLESAGWSSRCLKKLLAFSSPRGFGRACLQESQGI